MDKLEIKQKLHLDLGDGFLSSLDETINNEKDAHTKEQLGKIRHFYLIKRDCVVDEVKKLLENQNK